MGPIIIIVKKSVFFTNKKQHFEKLYFLNPLVASPLKNNKINIVIFYICAAILNNAIRHATDGFIGVLDMFGFEDSRPSQLEQLCINLCSETMQHFFNIHTLNTAIGTVRQPRPGHS